MFRLLRCRRCLTVFFAVAALLFSQLALASYVCPGAADAQAMAQTMDAGLPCEGMDQAQPVLCHQHATGGAQSFEMVKVAVPSLPTVGQVLVVPPALDVEAAAAMPVATVPEARPPPDPLFLATLRLRV